jgi:CDP-diacylglycerol--glycerol-3-phosphate 3-phosphatidyltransferase
VERRVTERSLAAGARIGLPVLSAVGLAVVLRALSFPEGIGIAAIDPAVAAGLCWGGLLVYVGGGLGAERPAERRWRTLIGLANAVTLVRGTLYAVVAGFALVPPATGLDWVPAVAYGVGVALDGLDGTIARTVGRETAVGERLDMAFDTFGFVAAPLVAVAWGALPAWYLSLSAARYVYCGGLAWRRHRGRPLFGPPDSDVGRYLAGVQMLFLTAALAPMVPRSVSFALAPVVLAPSLAVFARDFLVVSGRLSGHER